ncbi:MAG: GIY-YIG nuclease family protein [Oscillospiraceae bacterium]|nr:GIY-YIG nuclease family protein [Oscillospiraceae bacterium]
MKNLNGMDRKDLVNQYKNRTQIGGVFAVKNTVLNKWYVDCAADLAATRNRFSFMGDSFLKIAKDYNGQKGEGFEFEVLEELHKGETQSDEEFHDDLALLKSLWLEKLDGQDLY